MHSRRNFLMQAGGMAGVALLHGCTQPFRQEQLTTDALERLKNHPHDDEEFWRQVREMFTLSAVLINLNNGGVSPQPLPVQDAHIDNYRFSNQAPTYYMWRILDKQREPLRERLAQLAGCSPEEIAINRNATEGLNTVIFGLNLKPGDEVTVCKQDYPNMVNAWKQREKRDGIKLNWVSLDAPMEDEEEIAERYITSFTEKTKVVHITHLINWNGQITPAANICRAARERGIETIVDGAHSFAHIDFKIPDLQCDYFATSLHKWLCAPFGSGMLYIRKEKIKDVWALLSNDEPDGTDIRKFESLGTRSFASEMAIDTALDFHEAIGMERKERRLRELKNYWAAGAAKIPGVKLLTSLKPEFSCALACFAIEGMKPENVESALLEKYKIHTTPIKWENIHGVRVTPHVYTTKSELDKLLNAVEEMARGR